MDSALDDSDDNSSCNNSSGGDDDGVQPRLPKLPILEVDAKPKKTEIETRRCTARASHKILWISDYFYIPEPPQDSTRLRIYVRSSALSSGIGLEGQSKTMTPSHYGETTDSCTVTMLLLRAWSIWRAHRNAWASAKPCRTRSIDEDLCLLQRDVNKVRSQNGGSLGNARADVMWAQLQEQCPELAQ